MIELSYKRQRDVKSGKLNITGSFSSVKNSNLVKYESLLEKDYIHILEFDNKVIRYYEQPIKIYHQNSNSSRYYIPDFLVELTNGEVEVVEVKYLSDLEANFSEYAEKFDIAREFCSRNSFEFKVISEDYIRSAKGWNSKFLNYYKRPKFKINHEDVVFLERKLKEIESSTPKELINLLSKDENKRAELLYYLWHSISNYCIQFDIEEKLSMNTKIWWQKN